MVHEGNIHDTAVILLAGYRRLIVPEAGELSVLRRLNNVSRLCTGVNVERCGDSAVKEVEWLRAEAKNELGHLEGNEQFRSVVKEMLEIQKAKIPRWS